MPGFEKTRFYEASVRLFSRAVGSCASSTSFKRLFRSKTLFERQTGFGKCVSGQKVPNRSEQTELHRNDWENTRSLCL